MVVAVPVSTTKVVGKTTCPGVETVIDVGVMAEVTPGPVLVVDFTAVVGAVVVALIRGVEECPPAGTVMVVVVVGVKVMIEIGGNRSAFKSKLACFRDTSSTTSVGWPDLVERPSNVTMEFWAIHERFPALKLANIVVPESGTEKFWLASASNRGMACPRVTLWMFDRPSADTRLVMAHPVAPPSPQVEPVNPFVQMQEQLPRTITLVPPFKQAKVF